jgi:hypothetical protein
MTASTTGFGRFAGLLFSACLALLLIPAQARAADPLTISVGGNEYAIKFFQGSSYSDNAAVLQAAPWWGSASLATEFRDAFSAGMTSPYVPYTFQRLFAYDVGVRPLLDSNFQSYNGPGVDYINLTTFPTDPAKYTGESSVGQSVSRDFLGYAYVEASPAAVPEINAGSLSQALLILFALWLVTRRRAESHVA